LPKVLEPGDKYRNQLLVTPRSSHAVAVVSSKVAAQTERMLKAMYLTKLKVVMVRLLLFTALVGGGAVSVGGSSNQTSVQEASKPIGVEESSPPSATQQPPACVASGLLDLRYDRMMSAKEVVAYKTQHRIESSLKKLAESKDQEVEQEALEVIEKVVKELRNTLKTTITADNNKVPEGTWLITLVNNGAGAETSLAIVRTENGEGGKVNTKVVASDDLKISNVRVEGNLLKMVLGSQRGDWNLEAVLPGKDEKKMLGSVRFNSQTFPLTLSPTDKTELERELENGVRLPLLPPEAREINQLTFKAMDFRTQLLREKDSEKAAKLLTEAQAAEKEAAEKAPKLLDELLEKNAGNPVVIHTALNVLKIMGKVRYDQQQIQRIVGLVEKAAKPYGPAMNNESKIQIATVLTGIDGAAPYALEFTRGLEKSLSEKDEAAALLRVLNPLMTTLKKAGKNDEARAVAARIEKLDQILDKDYFTKVPPFKSEKYEGRITKSKRVVVMELFTGTQCGPCVAADVAFEALGRTYKPNELALIQYHMHIPGPDPLANAETQERWDYYAKAHPDKVLGTPTSIFNGKPQAGVGGGMPQSKSKYDEYRKIIDPLLNTLEEVQLTATASRTGNKIEIQAEVNGLKADDENKKLRFLLVEESIRYLGRNNLRYHHHVVRTFPGGVEGFALKKKDSKQTASVDLDELRKKLNDHLDDYAKIMEFPSLNRPIDFRHLKVIALVQDDRTSEILQAVEIEVGGESEK
jgi:hypothetical protein